MLYRSCRPPRSERNYICHSSAVCFSAVIFAYSQVPLSIEMLRTALNRLSRKMLQATACRNSSSKKSFETLKYAVNVFFLSFSGQTLPCFFDPFIFSYFDEWWGFELLIAWNMRHRNNFGPNPPPDLVFIFFSGAPPLSHLMLIRSWRMIAFLKACDLGYVVRLNLGSHPPKMDFTPL